VCGHPRALGLRPNGRSVDSEHYTGKLAWLARLATYLDETCTPSDPVAVVGDFNIAPSDVDVWDPEAFAGMTHVSEPERAALGGCSNGASTTCSPAFTRW